MALSRSNVYYEPKNIYYNASLYNNNLFPVAASYNEPRTTPLLRDASEWYLSVIRFSIPGSLIPVFIAQALPYPNTDINKLIYSVTLTRNGTTSGETNVEWVPESGFPPKVTVFTAATPSQNQSDPYYYNFSYQSFIDMINTALAAAYAALPDKGTTTEAPYMTFDPITDLFSLWAQQSYFQDADPTNVANLLIWFNTPLYSFFPSFQVYFGGFNPAVAGQNYAILIKDNKINTPVAPANYFQMVQEYGTTFSWNHLQSISFRSNSIPVNPESSTGVNPRGESLYGSSSGNQIAAVTDFEPYNDSMTPAVFRQVIQYTPTAEYRLTDLIAHSPLNNIDIQVYWTDIRGFLHQVFIPPGYDLTIKILFRRKEFYH